MKIFNVNTSDKILVLLITKCFSCRGRSRKNFEPAGDSNEAQKKFAGATAISSDQFFGPRDPDVSCVHITPRNRV